MIKIIEHSPSIDLEEFMQRPIFAHLATSEKQNPRVSPVWCLWKDETLWVCANIKTDSFAKRLLKNKNCALSLIDYDPNIGKIHHVGFRGEAEILPFDREIGKQVFSKYLGEREWPQWFLEFLDDSNARLIRIFPETLVIKDRSYGKT